MKQVLMMIGLATVFSVAVATGESGGLDRAPEFTRIGSRIFEAARYDASDRTLTIVFAGGAAYAYRGVPREIYVDFTRIVNKGEYFHRRIRKAFPCERIDRYPSAWATRD